MPYTCFIYLDYYTSHLEEKIYTVSFFTGEYSEEYIFSAAGKCIFTKSVTSLMLFTSFDVPCSLKLLNIMLTFWLTDAAFQRPTVYTAESSANLVLPDPHLDFQTLDVFA